jgi:Dimethyladenosine transferase (rRNA methylation)
MTTEEILQSCTIENTVVKLPEIQLERNAYMDVKKKLELIGGKWKSGKVQGFVFEQDPTDLLYQISSGEKRNIKKEFQFFGTPDKLADELAMYADLQNSDTILEPSAGQGAIIKAINKICDAVPDCYELMDVNISVLHKSNLIYSFIGADFLKNKGKLYSKIIANPPFTKNQDIDHLKEMYKCLSIGGRLVCVTSESWVIGGQKKQIEFRSWLNSIDAEVIDIQRGAFKESGTMVGGKIVIINK